MSTRRRTFLTLAINVLLVLGFAVHLARGQSQSHVLRGRALELTDEKGTVRCRINIEETARWCCA